jgi:ketosteroid isomerase-like protein
MPSPAEIVERYFDAWTSQDFDTARDLLHDDLSFIGPLETFDHADGLIESLKMLSQVVTGAERRGVLSDGEQVAVVYDLHTVPVPVSRVAEWYKVRDGKIATAEAFFDARPFAAMFEQQPA